MDFDPASIPNQFKKEEFLQNDNFKGDCFVARVVQNAYGESIRYCGDWDKWLYWNASQGVWSILGDDRQLCELTELAMRTANQCRSEIPSANLNDFEYAFTGVKCYGSAKMKAINSMKMINKLRVNASCFDQKPFLFNANNGTIDLQTGELLPFNKNDFMTKKSTVDYRKNVYGSLFHPFLENVFKGNRETISYMQEFAGYAMTGAIYDHILPIWIGDGGNGKGMMMSILFKAFGDYANIAEPSIIMEKSSSSHPTGLADLYGRRLVFACETDANCKFSEARAKMLTGGDRLKARRLYEDFWDFYPTHKIVLVTNHLPVVEGQDSGFWRRVHVVKFDREFTEKEKDNQIGQKIQNNDMEAVLSWAVTGAKRYLQQRSLKLPKKVIDDTLKYKDSYDDFTMFIQEHGTVDHFAKTKANVLFQHFSKWYKEYNGKEVSMKNFGAIMARQEKAYNIRKHRSDKGIYYFGVSIKDADLDFSPDDLDNPYDADGGL
jgi:putative DNA primase/helicase